MPCLGLVFQEGLEGAEGGTWRGPGGCSPVGAGGLGNSAGFGGTLGFISHTLVNKHQSQHTGGHPAPPLPVFPFSDGNKMDGKWEKQEVKSTSSKQAQARQRTPKSWVTAGKGLQEPTKAFMFREVRHPLLPLCHIMRNDNAAGKEKFGDCWIPQWLLPTVTMFVPELRSSDRSSVPMSSAPKRPCVIARNSSPQSCHWHQCRWQC